MTYLIILWIIGDFMKKYIYFPLVLFLSACATSMSESDMLAQMQEDIIDLQQQINSDLNTKIQDDINYQDCLHENNILRKIAENHRKQHPDKNYIAWSTPQDCKELKQIEQDHNVRSFFSGFYYKDLGRCKFEVDNHLTYRRMVWDYCDKNYENKDWQTCSDILQNNITINDKPLSSHKYTKIIDDLSSETMSDSTFYRVYSGRSMFSGSLEPSADDKILYLGDAPDYDVLKMSDDIKRISAVSLDCHKKDGRFKQARIEYLYKMCKSKMDTVYTYSASYCKCFAEKWYKYGPSSDKKLNAMEVDLAIDNFTKQAEECKKVAK